LRFSGTLLPLPATIVRFLIQVKPATDAISNSGSDASIRLHGSIRPVPEIGLAQRISGQSGEDDE
jgi:hypothetical protein